MKLIKLWLPALVWCGVIFYFSGIPSLKITEGPADFILRKLAHISEYFILTLLLYRAFKGTFNLAVFYLCLWSLGLTFLYAVSDEIHQLFVFERAGKPADVLIDALGIIFFYIAIKYNHKFAKKIMLWT